MATWITAIYKGTDTHAAMMQQGAKTLEKGKVSFAEMSDTQQFNVSDARIRKGALQFLVYTRSPTRLIYLYTLFGVLTGALIGWAIGGQPPSLYHVGVVTVIWALVYGTDQLVAREDRRIRTEALKKFWDANPEILKETKRMNNLWTIKRETNERR